MQASDPCMNTQAVHEEADTLIILHCLHTTAHSVVVSARDTDVLILLIVHFEKMACNKLWMKAGTSKKPKYIPIHDVCEKLSGTLPLLETLIPFHALSGCDTVSYFLGHSKKTAWKLFIKDYHLLQDIGKGVLNEQMLKDAEQFVCRMYGVPEIDSCDEARVTLFCKLKSPEVLPPTTDALQFHIQRAHYQAMVWRQAALPQPILPSPVSSGWVLQDGVLKPRLTSKAPVPETCVEIVSCSCTTGCSSLRCTCKKGRLYCTGACKCCQGDVPCRNKAD